MGKYERRIQRKLAARTKGCVEARAEALKKNARLAGVVERACPARDGCASIDGRVAG
jgi:hypothetical protein